MALGRRVCGQLHAAVDVPDAPATRVTGQAARASAGAVT